MDTFDWKLTYQIAQWTDRLVSNARRLSGYPLLNFVRSWLMTISVSWMVATSHHNCSFDSPAAHLLPCARLIPQLIVTRTWYSRPTSESSSKGSSCRIHSYQVIDAHAFHGDCWTSFTLYTRCTYTLNVLIFYKKKPLRRMNIFTWTDESNLNLCAFSYNLKATPSL